MSDWTFVIPVKGTAESKSRFGAGDHRELALAMALDTVEAALEVARVVVVTVDGAPFAALGASVVSDPGEGLDAAIDAGLAEAGSGPTAILLGDHPAVTPEELRAALEEADRVERAVVADGEGTGTALLTARGGIGHDHAFGSGSLLRHVRLGYAQLEGRWPGLARDVDLPEHLADIEPGVRTRDFLSNSRI